jgi:hypothetical protein
MRSGATLELLSSDPKRAAALARIFGVHVAVELKRRLNVIVPKALAHSLGADALLKQQRGVRVTEAVPPDRRQADKIADASTEASTNDVRILSRAIGPAENQVQVGSVGLAPGAARPAPNSQILLTRYMSLS